MEDHHRTDAGEPRTWDQLTAEVGHPFAQWREAHPKASWQELEETLDGSGRAVRARLLQEAALQSPTARLAAVPLDERPLCPHCHVPLTARGTKERQVRVEGDHAATLVRSYGVCPQCGEGFFPPGRGVGLAPGRPEPDPPGEGGAASDRDPLL
jgi:hypothetical protein